MSKLPAIGRVPPVQDQELYRFLQALAQRINALQSGGTTTVTQIVSSGAAASPGNGGNAGGQTAPVAQVPDAPEVNTDFVLDLLLESITESQLYQDLGERIDLIDGPNTLAGSVNARVQAVRDDLETAIAANGSAIISLQSADAAMATSITALGTRMGTAESNIVNLQSTTASQATSITSLSTTVSGNSSSISSLLTTTADMAASITTLNSTMGGSSASIETLATVVNGIQAKYTVKIDNNGHVAGFGLISEPNNGSYVSTFGVRADRFFIAGTDGSAGSPFTYSTTGQYVDGVYMPPGAYLENAVIKVAAVDTLKIKGQSVTVAIGGTGADSWSGATFSEELATVTLPAVSSSAERGAVMLFAVVELLNEAAAGRQYFVGILRDSSVYIKGMQRYLTEDGVFGSKQVFPIATLDAPSAASHTYSVKIQAESGAGGSYANVTLIMMEGKR